MYILRGSVLQVAYFRRWKYARRRVWRYIALNGAVSCWSIVANPGSGDAKIVGFDAHVGETEPGTRIAGIAPDYASGFGPRAALRRDARECDVGY